MIRNVVDPKSHGDDPNQVLWRRLRNASHTICVRDHVFSYAKVTVTSARQSAYWISLTSNGVYSTGAAGIRVLADRIVFGGFHLGRLERRDVVARASFYLDFSLRPHPPPTSPTRMTSSDTFSHAMQYASYLWIECFFVVSCYNHVDATTI